MLARIRKSIEEKDQGFTLIELLVVMIIIGILAAIAIPVFLNQRKKAVDSSLKSDLRTIAQAEETAYTDTQTYVQATTAANAPVPVPSASDTVKISKDNSFTITLNSDGTAYCIVGKNAKASDTVNGLVYVSNKGGLQPANTAGCGTF
ncbi:prepilin-type N-terminal cleavage/methylation domain-containing protein [Kineococcus sp. NPDC059986]|uniref:type IV pilin protein n=1 Tax=Kineococcus sp. NPDC059986 TaxID=3155538 RepID=UPI00344E9106